MAKKKRVKVSRKSKRVSKAAPAVMKGERGFIRKGRVGLVLKNLLLFVILFVVSVIVGTLSKDPIVDEMFWILAILTGFVAVALLIVLLIIFFVKQMKKK